MFFGVWIVKWYCNWLWNISTWYAMGHEFAPWWWQLFIGPKHKIYAFFMISIDLFDLIRLFLVFWKLWKRLAIRKLRQSFWPFVARLWTRRKIIRQLAQFENSCITHCVSSLLPSLRFLADSNEQRGSVCVCGRGRLLCRCLTFWITGELFIVPRSLHGECSKRVIISIIICFC